MASDASVQLFAGVTDLAFYKVVGGRANLHEYVRQGAGSVKHLDWQALYCQFLREHVLGTIPYRWDGNFADATLIQARLVDPVDVLRVDGKVFHEGGTSGAEKARMLKSILQIPDTEALMPALGRRNRCMLVRETEEEWELLLPHDYLERARIEERAVCRFKRHKQVPVTAAWSMVNPEDADASIWEPWPEGPGPPEGLEEILPDLVLPELLGATALDTWTQSEDISLQ